MRPAGGDFDGTGHAGHPGGCVVIGGGAVAELATPVVPPAEDAAFGAQAAGMALAGSDESMERIGVC